ncbi:MAG TPA: serine/threonine-protein kinase [Ktedonobacteraceae bacterium]|nr:serine/threonine-protein kinase [Ktedonobacteraceae bacterium]
MVTYIGRRLGQYRINRLIGHGGYGDVYEANDLYLQRKVAIKLLHARFTQEQYHDFLNEAQILAQLDHPNIVRILEFNVHGNIPYLVMELATKGTLSQRHPMGTQLSLDQVSEYVRQIANALEYIHNFRSGMAHLDVKPENMLIADDGRILLNDFGIASFLKKNAPPSDHCVGTVYFMAPECLEGVASFASDQYALAVIVFSWLTGIYPFDGTTGEIIQQHLKKDSPLLSEIRSDIPLAVEQVIRQGMAKKPEDRFESVREFALALEAARYVTFLPDLTPPHSIGEALRSWMNIIRDFYTF